MLQSSIPFFGLNRRLSWVSIIFTIQFSQDRKFPEISSRTNGLLLSKSRYNVTITALYFDDGESLTPADLILPISSKSSGESKTSVISLPDGNATTSITFPRNAERAVVSILASGNGAEEFWFRNVLTEYMNTFNNTNLYGYSPFREVQLLIDGILAGASWPFPIIFTGGISPGLWVPIVGIDTYDLPSFEIDVSPWLGILCDGKGHSFEIKVVGYDSKTTFGTVGSNWWVSGSVFVWTDQHGNQTIGTVSHNPNGVAMY